MGLFKKIGRALKKGARKLKSNIKKHGAKILGVGLATMIPGVGGLLGKALGTGGSGFMGGLFSKAGIKNALLHQGKKHLKSKVKEGMGGLLGKTQLGRTLSQGIDMLGTGGLKEMWQSGGGLKGLLGQAMNPLKGRSIGNLLMGGDGNTGLFQTDMFKGLAKQKLMGMMPKGAPPQMGGFGGGMPSGLLGMSMMQQPGQGQPYQQAAPVTQAPTPAYMEGADEAGTYGGGWTGVA